MLQTMSCLLLLSLGQQDLKLHYREFDKWQSHSIREKLDLYDETMFRNSIRGEITIWGGNAGLQVRVTEIGRLEVLSYEKSKGFVYLEKLELSPDECRNLCLAIRKVIAAFPDDAYLEPGNPNRVYFTFAYHHAAFREEVTVEGIDSADQNLVEKIRLLMESLGAASKVASECPQLKLKALTEPYENKRPNPATRLETAHSNGLIPQKYHAVQNVAMGILMDRQVPADVQLERIKKSHRSRHVLWMRGWLYKSSVVTLLDGDRPESLDVDVKVAVPEAEFQKLHAMWIQIANHLLQAQQPLPLPPASDRRSNMLSVRFGHHLKLFQICGIDDKDSELMTLLKKMEIATNQIKSQHPDRLFKLAGFPISAQDFLPLKPNELANSPR